jgi:hypothetical protein
MLTPIPRLVISITPKVMLCCGTQHQHLLFLILQIKKNAAHDAILSRQKGVDRIREFPHRKLRRRCRRSASACGAPQKVWSLSSKVLARVGHILLGKRSDDLFSFGKPKKNKITDHFSTSCEQQNSSSTMRDLGGNFRIENYGDVAVVPPQPFRSFCL